jgi:hypothetical protein
MVETRQGPYPQLASRKTARELMRVRLLNGLLAIVVGFLALFSPPLGAGCISWRCEYFDDTLSYGRKGRRRESPLDQYCRGRTKDLWERLQSRHGNTAVGPPAFLTAVTGVSLIATFLIALVSVFPDQMTGRLALFTGARWAPVALAPVLATIAVIPAFWIEIKRYSGMRSLGPYVITMPAYFGVILLTLLTALFPRELRNLFPSWQSPAGSWSLSG